jgi:hypothetical protein
MNILTSEVLIMPSTTTVKVTSRRDLTGPALRTFFRIAEAWKLQEQEQMRYILGIYKGLHVLLPKTADEWVRKPNAAKTFGGQSALDRMMSGNVADLFVVRQYVDAQRG